jgi:hypothetical protein
VERNETIQRSDWLYKKLPRILQNLPQSSFKSFDGELGVFDFFSCAQLDGSLEVLKIYYII